MPASIPGGDLGGELEERGVTHRRAGDADARRRLASAPGETLV
jgi:hypothetical protein